MSMRPVVVGLDNPHSDSPEMTLHPSAFPGSSGSRLFSMVREHGGVAEDEYVRCLERINLSDVSLNRKALPTLFFERFKGRKAVLLGTLVPTQLGVAGSKVLSETEGPFYRWFEHQDTSLVVVPHPSGLSRMYNNPVYRRRTGELLADLIRKYEP